jgi:hypothetical protein
LLRSFHYKPFSKSALLTFPLVTLVSFRWVTSLFSSIVATALFMMAFGMVLTLVILLLTVACYFGHFDMVDDFDFHAVNVLPLSVGMIGVIGVETPSWTI